MMTATLPKSYSPAESEAEIRAKWDLARAFHAEPGGDREPYCILIPPPNVTAALHLGHAFNNTLQDILIRHHRMRGFNTLWMPGTDHASIATQAVIEKRLALEGKKRTDFSREAFVAMVQQWKDEYEATIIEQLKSMGASCDWDRVRFTMDEMCTQAVREAFFRLFRDGLIYRGKRLVNWDPVLQTAVADDEVVMETVQGHMWYLRYPLLDEGGAEPGHVTVATTRPETMLGDTAVAISPKDPRAEQLRGRTVRLPIVDRVVPIIEDDYVVLPVSMGGDPKDPKAEYATGFLKVTPAHDPNDWEIGLRHGLDVINVMAPDASISDRHGWDDCRGEARALVGMTREDARDAVVEWFRKNDLLEEVRDYEHSVGHSDRSGVPIEPYLSDQWYVRVTDDGLRGEALRAMADDQFEGERPKRECNTSSPGDGALRFHPARYARTFQAWHENLRDWCISRQLWWGHRIPVWHKRVMLTEENWTDEICTTGLDHIINPGRNILGIVNVGTKGTATRSAVASIGDGKRFAAVAIVRTSDGEPHDLSADPLMPIVPDTAGEYDVYVCCDDDFGRGLEEHGYEQDPDVLDTWFSSGLWPLSTMGWPDPDAFPETKGLLETFNPSSVLCTAREIITLWVSRMVMFNRHFRAGTLPFRDVSIHAMIQDGHGQKMSKSLGNGVDPRDIIHTHGADALRFVLCQIATATQDVRLPVDTLCPHCEEAFGPKEITTPAGHHVADVRQACPRCGKTMTSAYGAASGLAEPTDEAPLARNTSGRFDLGRNLCNKLWNAARFALAKLREPEQARSAAHDESPSTLADRWIVSRLHRTLHRVEDALGAYQFNAYADAMYDFIWRDFCDWYLESIKPTVDDDPRQQQVLRTVLSATVRLLHPICPFVTETLWPHVVASGAAGLDGIVLPPNDLLATAAWPDIACSVDDSEAVSTFERVQELVTTIRQVRNDRKVPPRQQVGLLAAGAVIELIDAAGPIVAALAGLDSVERLERLPEDAVPFVFEGQELALVRVSGAVDRTAERTRLADRVTALEKKQSALRDRLANRGYLEKAPSHLVEETRRELAELESDLETARRSLETLHS